LSSARLGQQAPRPGVLASATERGERLRVREGGGTFVGVGGEQLVELVVGLERQQPVRLSVAQPLVVVGVEPQQLALMADRLLAPAESPEGLGERRAGAHVRVSKSPQEVTDVPRERRWPERSLAGGDAPLEQPTRRLEARRRLLREQHVRVGAVGPNASAWRASAARRAPVASNAS